MPFGSELEALLPETALPSPVLVASPAASPEVLTPAEDAPPPTLPLAAKPSPLAANDVGIADIWGADPNPGPPAACIRIIAGTMEQRILPATAVLEPGWAQHECVVRVAQIPANLRQANIFSSKLLQIAPQNISQPHTYTHTKRALESVN